MVPRVSVIIPTYNRAALVREAVEAGRLEILVAKYFLHGGQVQPLASTF